MTTSPTEVSPTHSLVFLEMAFRTDRHQVLADAGGIGAHTGGCGDGVTFYIRFREDLVAQIAFELHGCLNTNACANAVAEIAEGRALEEAWNITPELVAHFLQTLPTAHLHCAQIAVEAFRHALAHYQRQGAKPWKGSYRKPA
jgi:nitrogen fixation NifU-like protein